MTKTDPLLQAVKDSIKAYCDQHHDFSFKPADPIVRLHEPTFGADEIFAATEVMLSTFVTMGPLVKAFEQEFAKACGTAHAVMVNSGSSANLLAIAALANPAAKDGLKAGDEVIVPALSWSTTVWPIVQCGLVPVIVDIDPETMNIDPAKAEEAIGPRTRAIMPVHVYGNPCDMNALSDLCQRKGLILIEDGCEALGASFGKKNVGAFGRVGTFSFYYSHHIATFEGGICVTDDPELAELMRILRAHGWIRETENPEPFIKAYPDIDRKFLFVNLGYNLRATEMQGAVGSLQLPKLAGFVERRRKGAAFWQRELAPYASHLRMQKETAGGTSSWFGIPVTVQPSAPFTAMDLRNALGAAKIESRPVICGNIARQPGLQMFLHRVSGGLEHADLVMRNAFSFANHQDVGEAGRQHMAATFKNFFSKLGVG